MKKTGILASICAACVCLSLAGCSDTSWAVKTDNVTIPTGVYTYYLLNGASSLQQQAATSSAAATSSTSTTSSKTSSTDIWSQTVSGTNAATWAMNNAMNECKTLAAIEKLSKDKKVSLTSEQKKTAETQASSTYTNYKDLWSGNDISQASLQRIVEGMYLKQLLFTSYYGKGGEKAVADNDVSDYYTKNFVHVKQIFVAKFDSSTYNTLTGDKLTEAKDKAAKAFSEAKANPDNFDALVKTYNEDPGMTQTPTGYIFSKKTAASAGFDEKFTDLAFSLKDGEVGMAESDMGWFIEIKVKTDAADTATYTDTQKSTVLSEMKNDEYESLIKTEVGKLKFEQNESAMNKYSPKKLKLS